jgi:hypothetical protein
MPGALADDPPFGECDAAGRHVATRHVTSVQTGDVASTGATAADAAIVAAGEGAARRVVASEGAVIDALAAAARRAPTVHATARLTAYEVAGIQVATDARSVGAIVVPPRAITARR